MWRAGLHQEHRSTNPDMGYPVLAGWFISFRREHPIKIKKMDVEFIREHPIKMDDLG